MPSRCPTARRTRGARACFSRRGLLPCADSAHAPVPAQFLGWYNPLKKETQLDAPNIKKWLDQGAQPTETVANLLKKAMIMEQKGPKRVFNQLSTKAAAAAKAEKAAALKKAQNAKAEKLKAKAAAEGAFPRKESRGLTSLRRLAVLTRFSFRLLSCCGQGCGCCGQGGCCAAVVSAPPPCSPRAPLPRKLLSLCLIDFSSCPTT